MTRSELSAKFPNASPAFLDRNSTIDPGVWPRAELQNSSWTVEQQDWLKCNYPELGQTACALRLSKSAASVRAKASRMGLRLNRDGEFFKDFQLRAAQTKTGKEQQPEHTRLASEGWRRWWNSLSNAEQLARREAISKRMKEHRKVHPAKGNPDALRKVWSDPQMRQKRKERSDEASRKMWSDPNHRVNSQEFRQRCSDQMSQQRSAQTAENCFSRARRGAREDLGGWFRSSWEANYARYINFLIAQGSIASWKYEPETFWFVSMNRVVRS